MNLLRQYGVALVSLVVSLGSLGYATWRNETSEQQRNLRYASTAPVRPPARRSR